MFKTFNDARDVLSKKYDDDLDLEHNSAIQLIFLKEFL